MVEMATVELLSTRGLTRQYGGLVAVDNVNFNLYQDNIHAIIGPNGAGKTTLVSLICGRTAPSSGRIYFKGNDITGISSAKCVQAGIVYTFQVTSVFSNLICYENVALSVQRNLRAQQKGMALFGKWSMISENDIEQAVSKYLLKVGLAGVETQIAGTLPYGHQKLLEVAMSLAAGPELLILDEPTQGLAEAEIENLTQLIREISKSVKVLLIEHNMEVVFKLAEHITVMDNGSILAEGTPAEIENNHAVQASYLGN
jgi:branched-chain amino acid transport system ATP-binding protein|tara:strand:+ start:3407 stop:4177 length:771 start_codon:yes stop_codon:yes gene_type:complete